MSCSFNECHVIPISEDECKQYAQVEGTDNWKAYDCGSRSTDQLKRDIIEGKFAELTFAFQNRDSVVKGVRLFGSTPDDGVDLVLEKVGNVQIKINHSRYVNDIYGTKRDSWPSADSCLLVVAFVDENGSMQFMCQAPSKLVWKKSKFNNGWYLEKSQFIPWTNDEDIFQQLGSFHKIECQIDDIPEN